MNDRSMIIRGEFKTRFINAPEGVLIRFGRYAADKKHKAMRLYDVRDLAPLATASVNLDIPQEKEDIYIKNWSENEGILQELIKHDIIELPHGGIATGFVVAHICKLKVPLELFE